MFGRSYLTMNNKLFKISFVIPIFNSADILENCLISIRNQDYPRDKIEIITPDGGSKDNGPQISREYKAKVIKNPKILAEPGFMLGAEKASGDLVVYMGADNRLGDRNWIKNMIKPFYNPSIIAAFPWHRNDKENTWLTKYFNTFTDPVNHFVFANACNPLYFKRAYSKKIETQDYVVYNFTYENFPILAFDQGFTIRKSYKRPKSTEYDDILPVIDLIKKKESIAFVPKASNYHYTLEKGVGQFVKKMRWGIDNNLTKNDRRSYINLERKIRLYIWPIYAITIIGPIIDTIFGLIRDRKKEWIYHLPITFLMAILVMIELVRLRVLRLPLLTARQ